MNQKQQNQQEKQGEKDAISSLATTAATNNSNNSSNNSDNSALHGLQQRLEDLSTGKSDNTNMTNNNTNNNTNNTNVTNIILKDNSTQQNTNNTKNTNHKNQHKKNLPLCIKNILSPNAKIKSDRKSNYLYRHSQGDKCDTNLLLCLHGAGDTHIPYYNLVKQMNIPQCATLCIHASAMGTSNSNSSNDSSNSSNSSNNNSSGFVTLPFDLGYTWFEEMDYKTTGQTLDINDTKRIRSLHHASENIDYLIDQLIHNDKNDQGWIPERIFLLGFSAGACLAMNVCYNRMQRSKRPLGGVICIAGGIKGITTDLKLNTNDTGSNSNSNDTNSNSKEVTPLLLMGGSNDKIYSSTMLKADAKLYSQLSSRNNNNSNNSNNNKSTNNSRSKNEYDYDYNRDQDIVKIHIQPGKGHEMVNQKEEIQCMMQFFADNMVRRMIAMEGWSEVSSFST